MRKRAAPSLEDITILGVDADDLPQWMPGYTMPGEKFAPDSVFYKAGIDEDGEEVWLVAEYAKVYCCKKFVVRFKTAQPLRLALCFHCDELAGTPAPKTAQEAMRHQAGPTIGPMCYQLQETVRKAYGAQMDAVPGNKCFMVIEPRNTAHGFFSLQVVPEPSQEVTEC